MPISNERLDGLDWHEEGGPMSTHDDLLLVLAVLSTITTIGFGLMLYFAYQAFLLDRSMVGMLLDLRKP